MKKLSIFLLALLSGAGTMFASDTSVDGIWYNFDGNLTAEVTFQGDAYNSYSDRYSGEVVIPASVTYNAQTYTVTSIGKYAFYKCSGLISVTIPNTVTSIGEGAFWDCSGLTSLSVEAGNTVYDSRNNCNAIIETSTNTLIFGCHNTTIPNSVTSIGEAAFAYCSGLTSVTIPNSVTSIGKYAFYKCRGLTSVTIPNSVTNIGDDAFFGCSGLTSLSVEAGNTVYDSRNNCNAIIETSTNTLIFGCHNTTIPNSVTSIGDWAFSYCEGLTSITIPNSVTSIGKWAFYYCSGLISVTIPNSVTSIGDWAFSYCEGLTSITIPNSVTSIGSRAFYGCSGLTSVTNYATTPQSINSNMFYNVNRYTCVLNVPKESVSLYQAAEGWKEFTNIVGIDAPQGVEKVLSDKVKCSKLIKNGNVYILTDDKTYTITGQQVK